MRIMLAVLLFTGFFADACANNLEIPFSKGKVYVAGSKGSIQLFVHQSNNTYQLSHYSRWETIDKLFVSPDDKYLLVYHRANKEKNYLVTLYELKSRVVIGNAAPGLACNDVKWFHGKILFISGATGSGTFVLAYNYKLKKLFDMNVGYLFIDTKNEICFSYPVYSADDGIFTLYSLDTGEKKSSFDFKEKIKEGYILDSVKNNSDKTYNFVLWTLETHKKVTVLKRFD